MATEPNKNIRICTWNCEGINNKYYELLHFLTIYEIDILLATETKLAPHIHFRIPGYKVYRADHPSNDRKGGSAVFIKSSLLHDELPPIIEPEFQISRIQLCMGTNKLQIGSFYSAPANRICSADFWGIVHSMTTHFILGGDFNSKHPRWGSNITNPRGKVLHDVIYQLNLQVMNPVEPTHYPRDGGTPDLLDFFFGQNVAHLCSKPSTISELSSDHFPVLMNVAVSTTINSQTPMLIKHPFDWNLYTTTLESMTDTQIPLKTPHDIDVAVSTLTNNIQNAATVASECFKVQRKINKKFNFTPHISKLYDIKKQCRKLWEQTKYPPYKTRFNAATREPNALKSQQYAALEVQLKSLNTQSSLWKKNKACIINTTA